MTSISSLLLPLATYNASGTTSVSNQSSLLADLEGIGSGSGSGGVFGDSYSLDLSSAAQNILDGISSGDGSGGDSSIINMLTYSNTGGTGLSDIDSMAIQDTLAGNGPLPSFLKEVDAKDGLNATQAQALQNIAIENMNTDGSQSSIDQMAEELQQAGISNAAV